MKRSRRRGHPREGDSYVCPSCGETIAISVDRSAGEEQEYVEDCPVCCNPNVIHVEFFGADESPRVWVTAE
jgi:hypothetical protein